ncbi:unnamed protein product [Mycena citricolor]|uniref:F-box/LRR-repeat protein 15/At3g58940/PEG3-like LRR domain-containing protein n=1 Tax=Mycena citricolor TaxID=2018698 RepID=A0AAD2HP95_9AGAR|nr:unnamed protein product [Mycena citricolor]
MVPPPAKRRRMADFGAPNEDDAPSPANNQPNPAALTTRSSRSTHLPPLSALCSHIFARHFIRLRSNDALWQKLSPLLAVLPDPLLHPLLENLTKECPTYLKHEFLVSYFFKGARLTLSEALPGVQTQTIRAIERFPDLSDLELSGFAKIPDSAFAGPLGKLPHLRRLVLRSVVLSGIFYTPIQSTQGMFTCGAEEPGGLIKTLHRPSGTESELHIGAKLEVLKVAGISSWTDGTFAKLMVEELSLPALRTLKLAHLHISDSSIHGLLKRCPRISRLDVSFTSSRQSLGPIQLPPLQKLMLTATKIPPASLLSFLPHHSSLTTLSLGALGSSGPGSVAIDSGLSLTDSVLRSLIPVLRELRNLENVSLVGNVKLGATSAQPLVDFVGQVGRRCKWLNLSALSSLRSYHLAMLVPDDDEPPPTIQTLLLNNTAIDDEAAPFLAACVSLRWLEVAETKITKEGLFTVLNSCPDLNTLGLKSCRGVNVADRRRFFEVWEEEHLN